LLLIFIVLPSFTEFYRVSVYECFLVEVNATNVTEFTEFTEFTEHNRVLVNVGQMSLTFFYRVLPIFNDCYRVLSRVQVCDLEFTELLPSFG